MKRCQLHQPMSGPWSHPPLLQVTRVTRVHNRYLRNRFEERLESLVDMSDSSYKRSLEYLFFGENPGEQPLGLPMDLARSLWPLF